MSHTNAIELQKMMLEEPHDYLRFFTAFEQKNSLVNNLDKAKNDFFAIISLDNSLTGFFCLRGFDEGYHRPSFGVYVNSKYKGKGIANFALFEAEKWCREQFVDCMILKVFPKNLRAVSLYKRNKFIIETTCKLSGQLIMNKTLK